MDVVDLLLGRPLATEEEQAERIGPLKGIPIFGLDALSSAAYGPEAALTILLGLGAAGVLYIGPIILAVIVLLAIVYFSYRQTIEAYPHGGGSYTVATENLGVGAGLLAAASLMVDYVLTAAVGISAGVGALISAVPSLQKHTLLLCLAILAVIMLVNLRGMSESGGVFMVPTYLFIFSILGVLAIGAAKAWAAGGHPHPLIEPPHAGPATEAVALWLLLRAFASGCTAMTGVEAVSNGVAAFREPSAKWARTTLTMVIATLVIMLGGIAYLCQAYSIGATPPGEAGYQSVLSQLIAAVTGMGAYYWISMGSILLVLSLSANTAFADFPRLARAIAKNGYLPHGMTLRGRRLVYTQGIYALAFLTGTLLTIFGGVTDRLIPLYAVGAFMAFTLSQAGMVVHWKRHPGRGSGRSMLVNGLGAAATGLTTLVVLVAKFTEGAWLTVLLIPGLIYMMMLVRRHYNRVAREINLDTPVDTSNIQPHLAVLTVDRWSRTVQKGLRNAWALDLADIRALHVTTGEESDQELRRQWAELVEEPARRAGRAVPQLVVLESRYRFVIAPIRNYILQMERDNPCRQIAVLIPELVQPTWFLRLLHNHRSAVLKTLLLFQGDRRITVINIPWYLE
jgi:amino acid transporter